MSSRALRKALKEKEEQQRLQELEREEADGSGDDFAIRPARPQFSALALLGDDAHKDDERDGLDTTDDDNDDRNTAVPVADDTPAQRATTKARRKKAKKKNKANAVEDAAQKEELDDIDLALKELANRQGGDDSGLTAAGVDPAAEEMYKLLAVEKENLHVQNEMRKLFGRATLADDEDGNDNNDARLQAEHAQAGLDRRQRRHIQHLGANRGRPHGAGSLALRRNVFILGREDWPLAAGSGLGMELVEKRENGEVEYRYVHHRVYQEIQEQFEIAVASMDPNRIIDLMREHPTHISSMLQSAELVKSERDHTTAGEALERALFAMGRAVHSSFAKNMTEGKARLDFRRPENRELWLGGWRYMQNLSMRGTWRTVYEWAKLLLALSPEENPYALWLSIDQYALRCKQDLDYLNLSRNSTLRRAITDMPHVLISQGLAEYRSADRSKGQQTLYSAISRYPWFIARLMQELDIDAPPAVWGKQPRNDKEALHAALYAIQAKDIWNTPEHSALLLETAAAVPTGLPPAPEMTGQITLNEARHVILSEIPALIELVPREFTAQYTSASDPLPPPDSIDSYDPRAKIDQASRQRIQPERDEDVIEVLQRLFPFLRERIPVDNEPDPAEAMP